MKQKLWTLITDTTSEGRQVSTHSTLADAETSLFAMITVMCLANKLPLDDMPDMESGDWDDAWEYAIPDLHDQAFIDEHEIEIPSTIVWSLAVDSKHGTETYLFHTEQELDAHMWENCVDDYETSIKALQEKYDYDYFDAINDGHEIEGLTYAVEVHEVPIALPNATQFIKDMARFTTPEDEIKEEDCEFDNVDDFLENMGADRTFDDYQAFMHMVREARTILNGGTTS